MSNTKKRVLSGIRATGRLHLGNYFGAVKGMLALQDDPNFETLYMVADAHTLTTPYSVEELRVNRRNVIMDYLAAGLDPEKSILFIQSDVKEHFELAFYFSSIATIAKMQHLPTFKEKIKQHPKHSTMALLNYPVLMAADILLYKASAVPVGIDQEPHLEVAREIARKMNAVYGTDLPEPHSFKSKGKYVPSLTGEGKMSKSVAGSFINLTDDLEIVSKKIAKMPTDSGKGEVRELEAESDDRSDTLYFDQSGQESKGVKALMTLVDLFQGEKIRDQYEKDYQGDGLRYGDIKKDLAASIAKQLAPMQAKRHELESKPEYVDQVIREGAIRAQKLAAKTILEVKNKLGLN